MKLPLAWLVRLGLAGCCLILAGCGGGDVPDPDSDSHAAAETTPKTVGPPANVAPDTPAAPETPAPAQGGNAEVAAAPKADPAAAPTGGGSEAAPAGDSGAAGSATASSDSGAGTSAPASEEGTAKSDGGPSSTSEMLAMANGPAAPTEPDKAPEGGDPSQPQGSGASGAPGMPAGYPGAGGSMAGMQMGPREGRPAGMAGPGGRGGMPGMPGMPGMAAGEGGSAGGPALGGGGAGFGGNNANAPASFSNPIGGLNSFLTALRLKDPVRLAEATARRAATESATGNHQLFEAILNQDLATDSLEELARKLEGFRYSGYNQQKSSSRIGLTLTKQSGTSVLRRTITMRKEKEGWKVVDIGGQGELDKPIFMPGRMMRRR